MAYVVVVVTIINSLALVLIGAILLNLRLELTEMVGTAIQDEVRKQDDRIEKRSQRSRGQPEDTNGTELDPITAPLERMAPGVPYRRS